MGHKASIELESIINEIIDNSIKTKEVRKCKKFNPGLMAAYVDNNLSDKERRNYEKHLFNCDYCFNVYNNIQLEIEKVYKSKYFPVMDNLLSKALEKLNLIEKRNNEPSIIVKLMNMGLEILNISEFDDFSVEPVPLLRGKNSKNILKSFKVAKELKNNRADILLKYLDNDEINIDIMFLNEVEQGQLIISSDTGDKISVSLKQEINIDDLSRGKYKLFINRKFFINLEII